MPAAPPAPKVSIALPCHNAAATLPAALESLLAQTLRSFEIIAVDDGSTDATWDVLCAHARQDERLRPVRLAQNLGVALAANAALDACRAPLIARMDADDTCPPRRLEVQAALLDARPELDLVSGLVRFGGDREKSAGYAAHVDWLNTLLTHEDMSVNRFVDSPLAHPSVMFRRESLKRFGPYRQNSGPGLPPFPEDYEMWLRWLAAGARMEKVRQEVLVWNDPPQRLSRVSPTCSPEAFARVKAEYLLPWLKRRNPRHPEVICWGAGRESRRRLAPAVALGLRVAAYVDIDPRKIGQRIAGAAVMRPQELPPGPGPGLPFVLVNVGSRGAREEIGQRLAARGYVTGRDWIAVG